VTSVTGTVRTASLAPAAATDDWLPDGSSVIAERSAADTAADLWVLPAGSAGAVSPLVRSRFNQTQARMSPDGTLLAYVSDESGHAQVMVQRLGAGDVLARVLGDGEAPMWRGDGRELFFVAQRERLMAAAVTIDGTVDVARELFRTRAFAAHADRMVDVPLSYGVTRDGERFLLATPAPDPPTPITVVLGWPAQLR